jgi:hypothetical protein
MAVLTNKPVRPARDICAALGLAPYFMQIYGGNSFSTKKPNPEGLLALMAEAGAEPQETVLIGDSHVDVLTARNGGAWAIGCTFGLAPESLTANQPDVLVDSPADWTAALNPPRESINGKPQSSPFGTRSSRSAQKAPMFSRFASRSFRYTSGLSGLRFECFAVRLLSKRRIFSLLATICTRIHRIMEVVLFLLQARTFFSLL